MCVHDSAISSWPWRASRSGPTTSHSVPVTSRRTSSCGWMMWKLSSPCRVSSIVIESTRNGMSSVTMSTGAARLLQRRAHAPGAHLHQGAALRAAGGQPGVLGGHPGQPGRAGRDEFLDGHLPVVGVQEVAHVADARVSARLRRPAACRAGWRPSSSQSGHVRVPGISLPNPLTARYR